MTTPARVPRAVTETTSPTVLAPLLLLLVSAAQVPAHGFVSLLWGLVAVTFAGLLPLVFLVLGVRRGRWRDHHVEDRSALKVPLAFAMLSVAVGIAVLAAGHAPRDLLALVVAMFTGLAVVLVVSLWWKVSIHSAVAGGSAVILALVYGWVGVVIGVVLVLGAAWSRLALRKHTLAQVVVGALVGVAVAGVVFPTLR